MFQVFFKSAGISPSDIYYFKEDGPHDESVLGNFLRVLESVSVLRGFLRIRNPWDETHHEIRHQ